MGGGSGVPPRRGPERNETRPARRCSTGNAPAQTRDPRARQPGVTTQDATAYAPARELCARHDGAVPVFDMLLLGMGPWARRLALPGPRGARRGGARSVCTARPSRRPALAAFEAIGAARELIVVAGRTTPRSTRARRASTRRSAGSVAGIQTLWLIDTAAATPQTLGRRQHLVHQDSQRANARGPAPRSSGASSNSRAAARSAATPRQIASVLLRATLLTWPCVLYGSLRTGGRVLRSCPRKAAARAVHVVGASWSRIGRVVAFAPGRSTVVRSRRARPPIGPRRRAAPDRTSATTTTPSALTG